MAPYREEVRERFASPPYGAVRHCASATLVLPYDDVRASRMAEPAQKRLDQGMQAPV